MDPARLRAWWWHRQGLDGSLRGATAAEVLQRSGWARSVGGAGPYLTLFARAALDRRTIDADVAALRIHELPAARGCTYVLPASDYALGLTVGAAFGTSERRTALSLGVSEPEIAALETAVHEALAAGPLEPEAIRAATGEASRSLGPEGKKKGLTTTLPVALGALQSRGAIRRVPVNGRLDQQRYAYARWDDGPLARQSPSSSDAAFVELAQHYFRWLGPATAKEFQWFAGLGVRAAKAAMEPLGLVACDPGGELLALPEDAAAVRAHEVPPRPQYALVGSLDAITASRRDVARLVDPADADVLVGVEAGERALGTLADLPSHAILDRGRLIGLWEFDPERGEIAWATFDGRVDDDLVATVARTEAFVRDDLGDARSFSLDSPRSRAPRIERLRRRSGRTGPGAARPEAR